MNEKGESASLYSDQNGQNQLSVQSYSIEETVSKLLSLVICIICDLHWVSEFGNMPIYFTRN